jgi:transcription antitermination factor NusG
MTQSQLNQLTLEQLSELNKLVVKTIKAKRKQLIAMIELNVGDKVKVNHPPFRNRLFIVKKVNRTTATLQIEGGVGSYNVPISMIEIS